MTRQRVILSGAGLSAASGLATFRGAGGLWEGHEVAEVATPEAWAKDPALVERFYAARRRDAARAQPNPGHLALARLQRTLGPERVHLITQNVDGLLERAGAPKVLDMHGSLWRVRCASDPGHPRVEVHADSPPSSPCPVCGEPQRPDIVWFGEIPHHLPTIDRITRGADLFVAVGTSGQVYPAAGLGQLAWQGGSDTLEINPEPSGAPWFSHVDRRTAEEALPDRVARWIAAS